MGRVAHTVDPAKIEIFWKPLFFDIAMQALSGFAPENGTNFQNRTGEEETSNAGGKTVTTGISRGSP